MATCREPLPSLAFLSTRRSFLGLSHDREMHLSLPLQRLPRIRDPAIPSSTADTPKRS